MIYSNSLVMVHLIPSLMVGLGRNRVFGMLLCPKWPANQCKPVQQSRQLRPYCPDIYGAPCMHPFERHWVRFFFYKNESNLQLSGVWKAWVSNHWIGQKVAFACDFQDMFSTNKQFCFLSIQFLWLHNSSANLP